MYVITKNVLTVHGEAASDVHQAVPAEVHQAIIRGVVNVQMANIDILNLTIFATIKFVRLAPGQAAPRNAKAAYPARNQAVHTADAAIAKTARPNAQAVINIRAATVSGEAVLNAPKDAKTRRRAINAERDTWRCLATPRTGKSGVFAEGK